MGDTLRLFPGGKGANQAVAAARLGARVRIVGRVGDDANGTHLVAQLERDGVDVSGLLRDGKAASGAALIVVEESGQNSIAVAPGANFANDAHDARRAVDELRDGDILLMQLEIPLDAVRQAASAARERSARVVLNAAPVVQLDRGLLQAVDVLVVNESEAAAVAGRDPGDAEATVAAAREILEQGARCVVATLGAEGAVLLEGGDPIAIPPYRVDAVDTTAAGDSFIGALVASLARGFEMSDAVGRASAAGAAATSRAGAQSSLPDAGRLRDMFGIDWEAPAGTARGAEVGP